MLRDDSEMGGVVCCFSLGNEMPARGANNGTD
jgi:hypothetical protein